MGAKVGDRVFIGPGTVYWLSDKTPETCHPSIALSLYAATAKQPEVHPWHDALPAVAAWLVAHPTALDDLRTLRWALDQLGHIDDEGAVPILDALIAALEDAGERGGV